MTDPTTHRARLAERMGASLGTLMGDIMQYSARDILSLLQREDLSLPRMTTMMMLWHSESASISDISKHLNLSLGATSHLVDKLVEAGFVTRTEDPEDRRQKHVALTERGRAIAAEVKRVRVEELTRRLAHLPAPLLEAALANLEAVVQQLRAAEVPSTEQT